MWMTLLGWLAGLIIFLILLMGLYGIYIAPRKLSFTSLEVSASSIPQGFNGCKIVQFSDTHIGPHYSLDELNALIQAINEQKPDIVVFTGDLFDARKNNKLREQDLSPLLSRIVAPLGKFAIYGNHDFGYERNKRSSQASLVRAGFQTLINDTFRIRLASGEQITLSGLDDYVLGRPDPKRVLGSLSTDTFNLLLVHEPDVAVRMTRYPVDLQLSGHSHGGQVSLPLVGALIKTTLGKKYLGGSYQLPRPDGSKRPYLLYVNRGIGTTRMKVRIGSLPELTTIILRHDPSSPGRISAHSHAHASEIVPTT